MKREELCDWNLQSLGQLQDIPKRDVHFAALDGTDVRAVEVAFSGKTFLRKIPFGS